MIKHLCNHDLSKRYGVVDGGIEKIKMHPFFKYIDWQKLENKDFGFFEDHS